MNFGDWKMSEQGVQLSYIRHSAPQLHCVRCGNRISHGTRCVFIARTGRDPAFDYETSRIPSLMSKRTIRERGVWECGGVGGATMYAVLQPCSS